MRGTPVSLSSIVNTRGIIPAYAGNTLAAQSSKSSTGDHPRVCGEHLSAMSFVVFIGGSSPRMRGTLSTVNWSIRDRGIIPAYAGNTAIFPTSAFIIRDHPRVCGEHMTSAAMGNEAAGSSPRMRGTPFAPPTPVDTTGIIPAYAGNTQQASGLVERRRGSSPRMRGTPFSGSLLIAWLGIIPAYAGNTWNRCFGITSVWDHPRVCGEHSKNMLDECEERGSSPRMRGTLPQIPCVTHGVGIIPAYAGNTQSGQSMFAAAWDHPRVCGEHTAIGDAVIDATGSSPRMRGTLRRNDGRPPYRGIIPAYAGNTCEVLALFVACVGSSPRMRGTLRPR